MYRFIATLALLASTSFAFVQNPSISYLSALKMSEAPAAPLTLNPQETACVFIEFQNEFTTEGGALYDAVKECMEKTGTLGNARRVMDTARAAGCTIIHVPIAFEKVRHFKFHRLILGYDFNLLTITLMKLLGSFGDCKGTIWYPCRNQGRRIVQSWRMGK